MKEYNKIIGYSSLENIDYDRLLKLIRVNKSIITQYYKECKEDIILVAGAGLGLEAYLLYEEYKIPTIGIDINMDEIKFAGNKSKLIFHKQDLCNLALESNSISIIYCYHVLEHVNDHIVVLEEFNRVLTNDGVLFIGFPNKKRLFSYIGTTQNVTILEKIVWNFNDYKFRLLGKFENKYGAHAGFSNDEFVRDASKIFKIVVSVRDQYMFKKYKKFQKLVNLISKLHLSEIVYPSNYFICKKNSIHDEKNQKFSI